MKKLISGLVLFAAMGAAVFAQGLTLGGYVNSGIGIISSDEKDSDTIVKAYAVDAWQNGYRFRLNGSWANEEKTSGVNFRLQSQSKLAAGYLSLPYLYGWVKFLNNIFTVSGGIVDDGTWATADFWIGDDVGEGLGVLLKATPVAGLDLGFGAYLASQQSGGSNNILGSGDLDLASVALKIGDVKYVYSGAFTLPEVFRVGASFRWKNKAGQDTNSLTKPGYQGRHESSALFGDLRLLAVKDLTAVAAFYFNKIEDFDNSGDITISETVSYKIGDLGLGLNAAQFFYNRTAPNASGKLEKVDYDPGLFFNLWGSYAFGKVAPRLDLVYFIGGQSRPAGGTNTYDRHEGYGPKSGIADKDDDYSVFSIRPSVKFNLAANTFIELGDMINFDSVNFDTSSPYADSGDAKKKERLTNVFYVDVKWSF